MHAKSNPRPSCDSETDQAPVNAGRGSACVRCWVVALDCEARPILDALQLRRREEYRGWPLYSAADGGDWLVVSGIGRLASAAATAFLAAVAGQSRRTLWLNVGTAGHASLAVGELRRVAKVIDGSGVAAARSFFPMELTRRAPAAEMLTTVDVPAREYPSVGMVDMEAAGFVASASRVATRERIQLLKVVADNVGQPYPQKPDPRFAGELIGNVVEKIVRYADALRDMDRDSAEAELAADVDRSRDRQRLAARVRDQVRMSVTHARQLDRLLLRLQILGGVNEPALLDFLGSAPSARDTLALLEDMLADAARSMSFS